MLNLYNYVNIKAIHIIKDGQMKFEYIRENEKETHLFPVGCIFKSFLSVLVGIAIYEGKIGSIEDCIMDYISHEEITDINWYKLKIKHALSKTTGIIWPGPQEPIPANMQEVLELKFEKEPGISFQYKPDPQILVYMLEEIYGLEIVELFRTKIVPYFSNQDYEWDRDDIQGMKISVQLLDELGTLLLNRGIISGKRLFSEEYYEQAICKYSDGGFPECTPYGLGLWLKNDLNLSDMDSPHPENNELIHKILQQFIEGKL